MSDLISRQAAIDELEGIIKMNGYSNVALVSELNRCIGYIMRLPPAQTEIIHCGDCKFKDDGIDEEGISFLKCLNGRSYGGTRINDFCSWAERRTDG